MAKRLTMFSKLLIVFLILAAIGFGGKWILNNTSFGQGLKDKAAQEQMDKEDERKSSNQEATNNSKSENDGGLFNNKNRTGSDANTLRVQLVTWPGYTPGLYYNEGANANTRSRFYKDYGFKVEFVREDNLLNALDAWAADEFDILVQTADAFPLYTAPKEMGPLEPTAFMQVDWSRGGDAIIAKRGINSINDLRGKKVALAVPAPAQTMLITALESAGMSINDVKVVKTADNIEAAELFKSSDVDAAVVWSPFDVEATSQVPGSKILLTTVEQSHIIGDIMFAKKSVIADKREMFNGFYEGWMKAVAELKDAGNLEKGAKYLAEFLQVTVDDAKAMMGTVHYASHGDNMNFFGINNSYKGMTGGDLYNKMNKKFYEMKDTEVLGPLWRNVIATGPIINANSKLRGPAYAAEGAKEFKPATTQERSAPALASKPISISFATGQYKLSENAQTIIDLQFSEVAKSFGNVRVRVEGNTDNVGGRAMNMELSRKRAESVAQYLQSTYQMNKNRFIVVGNGPDKPVKGCESNATENCRAKNRRTEFQLLASS
ncbi:MAG: OmpA family protein [Saprospiraceae bacterium]|nr:OmpA family protein [Bacteroidia bacterium]NNE14345.1 OmpA family protein [Saprospiraceae bacterium]NNL92744.1 OmpA family protein [Saprospiraceae bacterium]